MAIEWRVRVGATTVSACAEPGAPDAPLFIMAHGAGGNMNDRGMLAADSAMRAAGLGVIRFNFPYRERGSGRPDAMPALQETIAAVVSHARTSFGQRPLVIGGRSMGGRAASMLAASGFAADGLLLLAYPLHPAGQPEKLRDAHLPSITMPALCVNGTRDALCRRDLMEAVLQRVRPSFRMHWLEHADHSFHVLKSSGRTNAGIMDELAAVTRDWSAAALGR